MYCTRCGAENADNKTLCIRCRKPLAIRRAQRFACVARAVRPAGR